MPDRLTGRRPLGPGVSGKRELTSPTDQTEPRIRQAPAKSYPREQTSALPAVAPSAGLHAYGFAVLTLQPRTIRANHRFAEMLGYTPQELERIEWEKLTPPQELGADQGDLSTISFGAADRIHRPRRWVRKDGTILFTCTAVECHRTQDGAVDYLTAILESTPPPGHTSGRGAGTLSAFDPIQAPLSARESEVARQIGMGHSVKEIASILQLSEKTISTYRTRLLSKLNLTSTAELIRYSIQYHVGG